MLRLLRRQESEEARETMVARILPTLRWLSGQLELIRIMEGHKLAKEERIAEWKAGLITSVVTGVRDGNLSGERFLGSLLKMTIDAGVMNTDLASKVIADDQLLMRLLTSVMSESSRWTPGDVASVESVRLPWEQLCALFGAADLATRVKEARSRQAPADLEYRDNQALDIAVRYAAGWRPKQDPFDQEDDEEAGPTPPSSPPPTPPA